MERRRDQVRDKPAFTSSRHSATSVFGVFGASVEGQPSRVPSSPPTSGHLCQRPLRACTCSRAHARGPFVCPPSTRASADRRARAPLLLAHRPRRRVASEPRRREEGLGRLGSPKSNAEKPAPPAPPAPPPVAVSGGNSSPPPASPRPTPAPPPVPQARRRPRRARPRFFGRAPPRARRRARRAARAAAQPARAAAAVASAARSTGASSRSTSRGRAWVRARASPSRA